MTVSEIARILTEQGFRNVAAAGDFITMDEPSCIIASLSDFTNFAWEALAAFAAVMLFGWAVALIRGAKTNIMELLRNLWLLFAALALIPALLSFLMARDYLKCDTIRVSVDSVNDILTLRQAELPAKFAMDGPPITDVPPDADAMGAPVGSPLHRAYPITDYFGLRDNPTGTGTDGHTGLDFGAPAGTPIYAVGYGTVIASGWNGNYGNSVDIDHGGGYTTRYGHMLSTTVRPGQAAGPDTVIGYVGSTGRSTGPHLHYEIRLNNRPMDPYPFVFR